MTELALLPEQGTSGALPGAGADWLDGLRDSGARRFSGLGLPTRRVEDWKYTDLRSLKAETLVPAQAGTGDVMVPELDLGGPVHRAVFVNGRFSAAHSDLSGLPEGVTALPLGEAMAKSPQLLESYLGRVASLDRKHFVALNTAWMHDGFVLSIAESTAVENTIELVFVGHPGDHRAAWHPRNLIVLNPGAAATVVERHIGQGGYLANTVTEVILGADSHLNHYKLQDESAQAFHVATTEVRVSGGATYENFSLSGGSSVARNQIAVELQAAGAVCKLNGAYLGRDSQQLDTTTLIDHAAPDCTSTEIYKGVLDDRSKGVFQGKIVVRKDAQRTLGHQSNKALLLSDRAEIDAKPELEIYADDVQCGHGATAGELDDNALFYLRARGIPLEDARGLLIDAFVEGAIEEISHQKVRDTFRAVAAGWRYGGAS
ncbi:MAG: Fe-S cluster assembly protein SufD [Alphaproteobacteria bacterium]|jgi:Fe-S cluster assembly protein SufD|nr:Fe-S cluster assembly protein SufD [Rhodospirillaceae bacterium]MBT6204051.1 Fe-S cluster assembly protein SufD [Rhodospirillaceae bacterium]MBT6508999.1 Fe-S cluster assembly protein SufD [Rhodospirillaceae bacterium]MBT7646519.1 Fe-S cluster assembly protein SufD [Rhodospirillaceae bacterium]MDG2482284.1 Fe-S cluster assembly protein SufD [Alphaproteobacteria bacterium]